MKTRRSPWSIIRRLDRCTALLVLCSCTAVATASSENPPNPIPRSSLQREAMIEQLQSDIRKEMRAAKVTGLSIAIVDDQRVEWAQGFGWADKAAGVPASEETIYRMGSISKLLTATAVMQLTETGRIALDRPASEALPSFAVRSAHAGARAITVRDLLTHHSGLPRDVTRGMWGRKVGPFSEVLLPLSNTHAPYPPRTILTYSNVGYTVLGAAVERAANRPFAEYMSAAILRPLGMTTANFDTAVSSLPATSKAYRNGEEEIEPQLRDVPAGGLNASVLDMSRFLTMVFSQGRSSSQAIISTDSLAEMLRPQNNDVPLDMSLKVGLAWMLDPVEAEPIRGGGPVIHHAGGTPHFFAQLIGLPEHKLGVIVASNSTSGGQAVPAIAKKALVLALQLKSGVLQPPPPPSSRSADRAWSAEALRTFEGDYATHLGLASVRLDGKRLTAAIGDKKFDLIADEEGRLSLQYRLFGLIPMPIGELGRLSFSKETVGGREVLVAHVDGRSAVVGQRILPGTFPVSTNWLGTYKPVAGDEANPFLEHAIVRLEGALGFVDFQMRDHPGLGLRMPLLPISESKALLLTGPLSDMGEEATWRRDDKGTLRMEAGGELLVQQAQ